MQLDRWIAEFRHAAQTLRRTSGFTVTAVLMLGLAIGATTGLFSVVNAVLLKPLPYHEPDRLVYISATAPGTQMPAEFNVAAEFLVHYREHSKLLTEISSANSFTNTLRVGERVERPRMSAPTHSMFATLGVQPILGRLPGKDDDGVAVVISHRLWQDWFNGDPDVLGKTVFVFGEERPVIGVMGPEFRFPTDDTLLWISESLDASDIKTTGQFGMGLVARLAPGATPEALAAELTALAKQLPERFGGTPAYAKIIDQHRAIVRPLERQLLGPFARPLWIMFAAAGLVLLIACANVTNLFLVRSEARHRELAVRRALGAGRAELLRLQMAEALLVALLAGALAIGIVLLALPVLLQWVPQLLPRVDQVGIDAATLLFAFAISLFAGLACGALPALRGAAPNLERLRDGGRGMTGRRHALRQAMVIAQTALALVLLVGSGLLLRSVLALRAVDPGYDPRDIFTFQIAPEMAQVDAPAFARFQLQFLDRLAALPGVQSVGLVENVPLDEGTAQVRVRTEFMGADDEDTLINFTYTAGDYFRTMGIAMLAGEGFDDEDHAGGRGRILVSRSAAERLWPGRDAIGQRLLRQGQSEWETVVGVVDDVLQDRIDARPQAVIYLPLVGPDAATSRPITSPAYVVKTARAEAIAAEVRALVREVAPGAPMYREFTFEGLVERSMVQYTFTLLTLGMAAALALVLGAIGLYGVLSYVIAERTREIGVRMALGARAQQVRAMVVAQGTRLVGIGIALGMLAAVAVTQTLGSLLFGVAALDPSTFVATGLAMLSTGLLASYLPARRASSVSPMQSLRAE